MVPKQLIVFLSIALATGGCKQQAAQAQKETVKYIRSNRTSIYDSLKIYFSSRAVEPKLIINNVDENQTEISFADHSIKWLSIEKETKIKIDNDLINLKNKLTLNKVAYDDVDEVDFVNSWSQIKYFVRNDSEEIVLIKMGFNPCTGMGCSVDYFLVYDLRRKVKNFFGTFRSDQEINLYWFDCHTSSQNGYYYLSESYREELPRKENQVSITYELFGLAKDGKFLLQKDAQGQPYYIKHTFAEEDTFDVKETMRTHWFEKIK
ncbi:MAG: hypothetical protein EOP45_22410 [Sphingobacteriaceae bacterium]|nr:MAG: hypothetical protein EOP45_22410 [Sphingobacteriaceae bacterium]